MVDEATRALEVLGLLYEMAIGTERWPEALDAIAGLAGGNGALLFVNDGTQPDLEIAAMSSRYRPEHAAQYLSALAAEHEGAAAVNAGWEGERAWVLALDALPPRTMQTDSDIWPDRAAYDAMPSVRFMRGLQLYHRVAVRPCLHGGWKDSLTVLFADTRAGLQTQEARRLSLLVPHLARAIEMQRPFKLLQLRYRAVLSVLDRLGIGVLILSEAGDIVAANDESTRMLDARDGIERSPQGRVRATDPGAAARLTSLLQRVARAARLEGAPSSARVQAGLNLRRRSGAEAYLAEATAFRDNGGELGGEFAGVLLVLIDPAHREMVAVEGLVHSYALSPAEALVCGMLAQGMALRDIADSRNVSLDTIKTQSRAIYAKTQTRNRGDLVRRALSISPPLRDGSGRRIN